MLKSRYAEARNGQKERAKKIENEKEREKKIRIRRKRK